MQFCSRYRGDQPRPRAAQSIRLGQDQCRDVFTDLGTSCCRPSKKGDAPRVNNVELGKRGRWRSEVWTYTGASSLGSDARRGLHDHPTVRPAAMLEDVLLDLATRGARRPVQDGG
jgi:hypothetical protein